MHEEQVKLLNLYKEGKITEYVFCQELSGAIGSLSEIKIYNDAKPNTVSTFGIFVIPELKINGIKITYLVDKQAIDNFYSSEELIERLFKLSERKQSFIKEAIKLNKGIVLFNSALSGLLRIYQSILDILSVEGKDFIPTEEKIAKLVNDFEDGKVEKEIFEGLKIENLLPEEVVCVAKQMAKEAGMIETKLVVSTEEKPSMNLGQQEIRALCNGTFGTREHKEIKYDYLPNTNQ